MNAPVLLFLLLSFLFHTSSCSRAAGEDKAATMNANSTQTAESKSPRNDSDESSQTVESARSPNPKDDVLFDGKNYIKKSGWKVPSRDDTYIDDNYQLYGKSLEQKTEDGNKVETYAQKFEYRTPRPYSDDFRFEGDGLNYMRGSLECHGFFEVRANGKVFMYTVFMQRTPPRRGSNNYPHEDANQYQIQDKDGDGIFETLLGDYDEIVVPNWVLR